MITCHRRVWLERSPYVTNLITWTFYLDLSTGTCLKLIRDKKETGVEKKSYEVKENEDEEIDKRMIKDAVMK